MPCRPQIPVDPVLAARTLAAFGGIVLVLAWGCGEGDTLAGDRRETDRDPASLAYERGQNALAEQRFDWARKHFEEALAHDPDRVDALRLAGVAWLRGSNQSLAPAMDYLRHFLERRPGHVEASQHLARCLSQLGQVEEALGVLEAVDLDPADLGAPERTSLALQRASLLLAVRPEAALSIALGVPMDDPEHYRALALASEAHEHLGQLGAARDLATASLRLNPLQEKTVYRVSRLLLRQRKTAEATRKVELYQVLTAVQESTEAGAKTAIERLRRWPELAQQVDVANPHVAALRARLLLQAGDPEDARPVLEALAASSGLSTDLRIDYCDFLLRLGDSAAAERVLREGLVADPDHRTLRYQLANLLLRKGDLAAARGMARESLDAEPHLGRHHYLLAQIALSEGREAAAREALARALDRAPWKARWRAQALDLLWRAGERGAAEDLLADAPEPDPILEAFARRAGLELAFRDAS